MVLAQKSRLSVHVRGRVALLVVASLRPIRLLEVCPAAQPLCTIFYVSWWFGGRGHARFKLNNCDTTAYRRHQALRNIRILRLCKNVLCQDQVRLPSFHDTWKHPPFSPAQRVNPSTFLAVDPLRPSGVVPRELCSLTALQSLWLYDTNLMGERNRGSPLCPGR